MEMVFYIGWLGSILYIIAYFLLVRGSISAEKSTYHILNGLGGTCLIINALSYNDFPNVVVNALWVVMAVFMLYKLARNNDLVKSESE